MLQSVGSQRAGYDLVTEQQHLVDSWAVHHENPKAGCLGSAQATTTKHHRGA